MAKEFAKQFYDSKLWQDTRAYILNRDNWLCVECGRVAEEVHHIIKLTPDNIDKKEIAVNPKNLVSLCRPCHQKAHELDRHEPREAKEFAPKTGMVFDENGNLIECPPPI